MEEEQKVKIVCKASHVGRCPFEGKTGVVYMYWNDDCVGVQVEGIPNLCFFNINDLEPVEDETIQGTLSHGSDRDSRNEVQDILLHRRYSQVR